MKLRTQILVFLFLFAFVPLFISFAINLPLVLDRFEYFYHEAHTQNLRADFRDMDQHLASRYELVSLLAKLAEPGNLLPELSITPQKDKNISTSPDDNHSLQPMHQYASWINRIMAEQLDIVLLAFISNDGELKYAFMRDQKTANWQYVKQLPVQLEPPEINEEQRSHVPRVLISPIIIRKRFLQQDQRLFMTLNFSSPTYREDSDEMTGHLIITVDVTGFAHYYQDTIWVQSNGQYLFSAARQQKHHSAFDDYPGLDKLFAKDHLVLWEGNDNKRVIWIPMLRTASGAPLWVGRYVDPSPIADIQFAISWRVITIMMVLVTLVFYLAKKFAHRAEQFDQELTSGISQILEEGKAINLKWKGPVEIQELADKLSRLSEVHANNTQRILDHTRELEISDHYKSKFLTNVSHELRTPLNSILLLSKLIMEDTSCRQDQIDKAHVINAAGKDLKSLIDNILDLSKIEAGKTTFDPGRTNIKKQLEELIILMKPQFEARQLSLQLTVKEHLPETIFTDANMVGQIIKNFLSNALKFTEHGTVEIIAEPRGKSMIILSVKDNGIGVDEEKQAHIFGAFQQADSSINRRHGGTGLGLTISNQLASLLGGKITLQSTPGEGACFSLHLPVHFDIHHMDKTLVELKTQESERNIAPLKPSKAQLTIEEPHILIIDNELQTLLSLTPVLKGWGYRISGAGDREEALETLACEPDIDLILMDINTPFKDGDATTAQAGETPILANIPVIAMIPNQKGFNHSYRNIKAEIDKPIDINKLKTLLEEFLL